MSDETELHLTTDNNPQPMTKGPVGHRLKALREQRGLTLNDFTVFAALPQSRVEAFERGEYSQVGIDTFVIGYIRKYANWLDVDVSAYISDYHREPSTHKKMKTDPDGYIAPVFVSKSQSTFANTDSRAKPSLFSAKALALIVLILVCSFLLLVLLFSNGRLHLFSFSTENAVSSLAKPVIEPSDTLTASLIIEPSVDALSDIDQVVVPQDSQVLTSVEPVLLSSTDGLSTILLSSSSSADNGSSAINHISTDTINGPLLDSGLVTVEPLTVNSDTTNTGRDNLVFTFTDDCWLEISSHDQVLFVGLKRAGETHTQQGRAPFNVMLGNVNAASLLLNDQPFDIQPVAGRNTLRFTVMSP